MGFIHETKQRGFFQMRFNILLLICLNLFYFYNFFSDKGEVFFKQTCLNVFKKKSLF